VGKQQLKNYDEVLRQVDYKYLISNGIPENKHECSANNNDLSVIKIVSHIHPLKRHSIGHHKNWNCDRMNASGRCLSGLTDFY
jgi:hypothetical protein